MTEERDPKVEALEQVAEASAKHERAIADEFARRNAHHEAILKALRAGAGPSTIEKYSKYDRQHIDRIRRTAKIPPTRRATVQRVPKKDASEDDD